MELSLSAREKLEYLYNHYEQSMYRVAYAILKSEYQAEDAVSVAFVKIADKLDKIDLMELEKAESYIFKIIKTVSINQYRFNKKELDKLKDVGDISQIQEQQAVNQIEQSETKDFINEILMSISVKYRKIVIMRCIYEMSFKEIAEELNEKTATVRKQYERAKKLLLKTLRDAI